MSHEPTIGTPAPDRVLLASETVEHPRTADFWGITSPAAEPDLVEAFHYRTGNLIDLPLFDVDGAVLRPDLIARLEDMPRRGTLIATRDPQDRRRKVHLPWQERYLRECVPDIRTATGIDPEIGFMGLRHGRQRRRR